MQGWFEQSVDMLESIRSQDRVLLELADFSTDPLLLRQEGHLWLEEYFSIAGEKERLWRDAIISGPTRARNSLRCLAGIID
jgi:hypothetical protein